VKRNRHNFKLAFKGGGGLAQIVLFLNDRFRFPQECYQKSHEGNPQLNE
jgi:hypothetical protein